MTVVNRHTAGAASSSVARPGRSATRCPRSGQTLVELAACLTVFVLLLFGVVQAALIANAALAVSQLTYAGARYASVHGVGSAQPLDQSAIASYMKSIASPTINENSGNDLTITVSGPRTFGTPVSVKVTYDLTSKLLVPNPFFGVTLPTSLPNFQTTMMTE